ncbi:alanine--tRNA ligase [Limisphaera sp. VF-2]|uniref:alanine--tRNA ligase n=1 Tax=Limisphaera sp. VF-2 TaxID=3400418 RepID=UPI00175D3481|nr:alanine--tRNA ligase [Limisphaera sp.]
MTSAEIRQSFLDFFRSKGHTIVPSSSLLPDSPNLLFTNAGMNQFVPIFLGLQPCPYDPPRAADTQKCIRAGGKHNDLEDVGLDTYHHTFFEMLGNWSFGDYFKREAIEWAWELVTEVWRFPKERIYATVYRPGPGDPAEFDEEAWEHWARLFRAAGLDPQVHIRTGGRKDNFWMMGDTGPCGPCSEIHVDLTPEGDTRGALVNQGHPQCIEIWNLVFIQFNANPDGTFTPLPARHVDTGMGFERVTAIIQGTRGLQDFAQARISNYETDVFRPLFDALERLSGRRYGSTLPRPGTTGATEQERVDVAFRVIADHIRTLGFAIADGILPSNEGRGYVLRRILRRAVRYGRNLGFRQPFFHRLVPVLAQTMGDVFPEIRARQAQVEEVIRQEEEAFNRTLDRGLQLFEEEVERLQQAGTGPAASCIPGEFAFKLYDTYGFPLDLTQLMARERGLTVDTARFEALMEEQRARARAAQKKTVIEVTQLETETPTQFLGYQQLEAEARVLRVVRVQDRPAVVLEASPFYAEMGGQVGDTGELIQGERRWRIVDTRKAGETWLHFLAPPEAADTEEWPEPGQPARLRVDRDRRLAIQRHHTATHLFHWALREVVGRETAQKGSYVGPDKLTFDFNSAPLRPDQLQQIERLVNERILENAPVTWIEVKYDHIRHRPDILQFFGEKYGQWVRVVQIGGTPGGLDGYSMELCGGTHTAATGEIGLFRILGEGAVAAGIRRVEAVAGLAAWEHVNAEQALLRAAAARVNAPVAELDRKLEALLEQQKALEKQLRALQQKQAAAAAEALLARVEYRGDLPVLIARHDADAETLQTMVNALKARVPGLVLLGGVADGVVSLVAAVSGPHAARVHAGQLIQQIAPLVGGKGGGRPDHARGGGRDATRLDAALARARELVQ